MKILLNNQVPKLIKSNNYSCSSCALNKHINGELLCNLLVLPCKNDFEYQLSPNNFDIFQL